MTNKPNTSDNVIEIDQLLENREDKIDFDLTDAEGSLNQKSKEVDFDFGEIPDHSDVSDINYSRDKSIVRATGTDITIRPASGYLDLMREKNLLDAKDFQEKRIVHPEMDKYEILNTFREIRTNLLQKGGGKNKVVMVVSLQPGMGATFSSINLAAAFSYEGEKTSLVVDCDQKKRKLEKTFGGEINHGLTDYLGDSSIGVENIIYPTGVNRMRYIPVGNRLDKMTEFYSSEKMKDVITQVKKRYNDRYIILNAPPLEVSADAAILSDVSDFIVVVLAYGKVSSSRLEKALRLLPKDKIVGIVINNKTKYV